MQISEEVLMAYADDELEAPAAAQVEAAIREDPELGARVAAHRALRARLQTAFAGDLAEPVPRRLIDAARMRRARSLWRSPLPLAAAASLVIGTGVGYIMWHPSGVILRENTRGALVADGRLAHALSDHLAGAGAPDGVDIVLSFLSKSGAYCRTFRIARRTASAGLACRNGTNWRIDVLARSSEGAGADSAYRTAGSSLPPAVLNAIQARIVDQPLDRAGEIAARRRGWKASSR